MTTTTIRVSLRTRDVLQELAQASGNSMQVVLEQALEQYRRQQLLEATNAAYAALRAHPEACASLEQERLTWDQTRAEEGSGHFRGDCSKQYFGHFLSERGEQMRPRTG
jgi:predicted transcriptional regulator